MHSDAPEVITFLTTLFTKGLTYNSLNLARSALASFVTLKEHTIGSHPLISRFLKGVYIRRPPRPRYEEIWDVKLVLNYLRRLSPANALTLKQITQKLVMLLALVSAQRTQTLHKLRLDNLRYRGSTAIFHITDLIKQSRPGKTGFTVELEAYPVDRRLCVVTYLKHYIHQTRHLRGKETQLFISVKKPHEPVSKDTISRWISNVLKDAGIDVERFKPHSTRAASTSAANELGVPVSTILKTAGWSNEQTFSKYYKKPVKHTTGLAKVLLDKQ